MAKESTSRAREVGAGLRHVDVANFSVANMGGVYAHDFCTSLENKTTTDLHLAIVDAGCGNVKSDGTIENMTLTLHRLAAGEKAPNMACWKEFNLAAAATWTTARSGTGNIVNTITLTSDTTGVYYVVTVNTLVPSTLTVGAGLEVVNNTSLGKALGVPKGVTTFMVWCKDQGEATTITLTCAAGTTTGIGAATPDASIISIYPVTPWTIGLVNTIY